MAHPRPLMLPTLDRFSALFSLVLRRWSPFQAPALISSVVCNVVALHGSIWLSALRQPAHQRAAPKCHRPSPWRPPVLRQSAIHCGMRSLCKRLSRWAVAQVLLLFPDLGLSGTIPASHTKGSWRVQQQQQQQQQQPSIVHHQGTACLFSSAAPSRHSLTMRSSGTLINSIASATPYGRPLPWR